MWRSEANALRALPKASRRAFAKAKRISEESRCSKAIAFLFRRGAKKRVVVVYYFRGVSRYFRGRTGTWEVRNGRGVALIRYDCSGESTKK